MIVSDGAGLPADLVAHMIRAAAVALRRAVPHAEWLPLEAWANIPSSRSLSRRRS